MSTWTDADTRSSKQLAWAQVDVFAEAAYEGNMLGIFSDARGLTTAQMQQLARETNLSETTFILPEDPALEAEEGVRVRIFTVEEELPFAGHPTLGTASWLWANHPMLRGAGEVKLKLNVGTVPVRFTAPAEGERGVYGEMRQRDPQFGATPSADDLAAACGLWPTDLHPSLPPQTVSTGLPFCVLPLASLDALSRLRPNHDALSPILQAAGAKFLYALTPADEDDTWRARMPFYLGDDPATGSAAGCAISYLVRHGAAASGAAVTILQGQEVRRPSRISVRASLLEGAVTDVFVGGRTISVANGWFTHP